mmetsp:Transcript_38320/g.96403  ORF Transcript_38320/g.96403 Transcript_38320/m.96403 type:complete len:504 (-) Transcript_38320:170-1681(-)
MDVKALARSKRSQTLRKKNLHSKRPLHATAGGASNRSRGGRGRGTRGRGGSAGGHHSQSTFSTDSEEEEDQEEAEEAEDDDEEDDDNATATGSNSSRTTTAIGGIQITTTAANARGTAANARTRQASTASAKRPTPANQPGLPGEQVLGRKAQRRLRAEKRRARLGDNSDRFTEYDRICAAADEQSTPLIRRTGANEEDLDRLPTVDQLVARARVLASGVSAFSFDEELDWQESNHHRSSTHIPTFNVKRLANTLSTLTVSERLELVDLDISQYLDENVLPSGGVRGRRVAPLSRRPDARARTDAVSTLASERTLTQHNLESIASSSTGSTDIVPTATNITTSSADAYSAQVDRKTVTSDLVGSATPTTFAPSPGNLAEPSQRPFSPASLPSRKSQHNRDSIPPSDPGDLLLDELDFLLPSGSSSSSSVHGTDKACNLEEERCEAELDALLGEDGDSAELVSVLAAPLPLKRPGNAMVIPPQTNDVPTESKEDMEKWLDDILG